MWLFQQCTASVEEVDLANPIPNCCQELLSLLPVVFLCGRPGCGRESAATLQIDAVAATVTLVDPRVSRDGVPLCAHHADLTTPPMGWSMNDMRGNRSLSAVPTIGPSQVVEATPRPAPQSEPTKGTARPARQRPRPSPGDDAADEDSAMSDSARSDDAKVSTRALRFPVSRHIDSMSASPDLDSPDYDSDSRYNGSGSTGDADGSKSRRGLAAGGRRPSDAPSSRPSKRREVDEEPEEQQDRFPWHFQFKDDEPEELQAKSPLLSRAFRYSVG